MLCVSVISFLAFSCTNSKKEMPATEELALTNLPTNTITVKDLPVEVEVATSDADRAQGLSGRKSLQDGKGMLFVFSENDFRKPGFWMKNMLISIDIIWIADGKIVGIAPNLPLPLDDGNLPLYYPPTEINYVLEVPAGWCERNDITTGGIVSI